MAPPASRLGSTRCWEGMLLGQLTPTDQRGIPYRMTSCSAYKAGRRRRKGGDTSGVMALVFLSHCYAGCCAWGLLSWRLLNTCLSMGRSEWIPSFALLACVAFALPVKLTLSQPMSFLFWFSSPSHCRGVNEGPCGASLPGGVKTQKNQNFVLLLAELSQVTARLLLVIFERLWRWVGKEIWGTHLQKCKKHGSVN